MPQPSNRNLALAAALLVTIALGAGLAGILGSSQDRDDGAPRAASNEDAEGPAEAAELSLAPGATTARSAEPRAAEPPSPPPAAAEPEPAEPKPEASPEVDLKATRPFLVRVVNEEGVGVAEATVTIGGLRSEASAGSWYGYRGESLPAAITNRDGEAELDHWVWVDQDGRVTAVDLRVEHSEYTPFRDSSADLGTDPYVVTLRRGATVLVSGWVGEPGNRLQDITVQVDSEARLAADDWGVLPDGTRTTTQLKPGAHFLRVRHESEEHGQLFSELQAFELSTSDWQAFDVELFPGESLEGVLDPAVPRPIRDGHVQLCLHRGGVNSDEPDIASWHETEVAADGSFRFEDLPRGDGQWIAVCAGWYSKRTMADEPAQVGISYQGERTREEIQEMLTRSGDRAFLPQRVRVPAAEPPVVVEMEQAGVVEVRIEGPDGAPLEGAVASASPNVSYFGVGSSIVPFREWFARTDASGIARIPDLPPQPSLWIAAGHADFEMERRDRVDNISVEVRPGETTQKTIRLVERTP